MCRVPLYWDERQVERDKKKAEYEGTEERGEREKRGRQGKREKCGGSMSASDKGISLPPVGQRERLTLPALPLRDVHIHAHTPLCGSQLCCLGLVNK